MTHNEPHTHDEPAHTHEPTHEPATGLTAYALVKYGFILIITIVILYFIAKYVFPRF